MMIVHVAGITHQSLPPVDLDWHKSQFSIFCYFYNSPMKEHQATISRYSNLRSYQIQVY